MGLDDNRDKEGEKKPRRKLRGDIYVGTDPDKINDSNYLVKVRKKLARSVLNILEFSSEWQLWLIRHTEDFPEFEQKEDINPVLKNKKLDYLLRRIIEHIKKLNSLFLKEKKS